MQISELYNCTITPEQAQLVVERAWRKGEITKKDLAFWKGQVLEYFTYGLMHEVVSNKTSFKAAMQKVEDKFMSEGQVYPDDDYENNIDRTHENLREQLEDR
jgi:hypothetical protein